MVEISDLFIEALAKQHYVWPYGMATRWTMRNGIKPRITVYFCSVITGRTAQIIGIAMNRNHILRTSFLMETINILSQNPEALKYMFHGRNDVMAETWNGMSKATLNLRNMPPNACGITTESFNGQKILDWNALLIHIILIKASTAAIGGEP